MVLAETAILRIRLLRLEVRVRLAECRIEPRVGISEGVVGGGYQVVDLNGKGATCQAG